MSPPDENERLLAVRAADGDGGAIEQLYDRYEKRLFNYCHRITGNREDAADASQEAFCNVIQRLPGVDTSQLNFGAYLFTAARNACLDIIALRKRAIATDEVPEEAGALLPIEFDPERSALNEDQKRAARAANAQLPEKQRTVLALREVAELSYDDIASAMEMNSNSVAQLISRARLNFFKQLRTAAVVIPPLDEAGERAIELAVARQDGRIEDEELTWLEQHLRENEASRINVEAIHEASLIYRAIGPVAVVAALRDETVGKAVELLTEDAVGGGSEDGADHGADAAARKDTGTRGSDATTVVGVSAPGASSRAGSSPADPVAADDTKPADDAKRRRRVAAATIAALLLIGIVVVSGALGDGGQDPQPASEALAPTGPTGEPNSAKTKSGERDPEKSLKQQTDPRSSESRSGTSDGLAQGGGNKPNKKKRDRAAGEQAPADTPAPTEPAPQPPPSAPTGPTKPPNLPPSGPGDFCSTPPCSPPPPVP